MPVLGEDDPLYGSNNGDVLSSDMFEMMTGFYYSWIYGRGGDDRINGGRFKDRLYGDQGHDIIDGEGGNDVIYGGSGNDTLIGGSGNDFLSGGTGDDIMRGGLGDDILNASTGDDELYGEADNDLLAGLGGADRIDGGEGIDTASYINSFVGVEVNIYDGGRGFFGDAEGDRFYGIENVRGSNYDDFIIGNDLANELDGGYGNDTFLGNGGNDRLIGYFGDDFLTGGLGADILDGGRGTDTANYNTSRDGISVSLLNGQAIGGEAQGDTFISIENIIGTNEDIFGDRIEGDDNNNRLEGKGGNDDLWGRDGEDVLIGGAGDDSLRGNEQTDYLYGDEMLDSEFGSGNDKLAGGRGDDFLFGGYGIDELIGQRGFDTLWGGPDRDFFTFENGTDTTYAPDYGFDTVMDFEDRVDLIDVSGGFGAEGYTFGDLFIMQNGSDTDIGLAAFGTPFIRLAGINASDIDAGDFVF